MFLQFAVDVARVQGDRYESIGSAVQRFTGTDRRKHSYNASTGRSWCTPVCGASAPRRRGDTWQRGLVSRPRYRIRVFTAVWMTDAPSILSAAA
jgi:hypothetical protein